MCLPLCLHAHLNYADSFGDDLQAMDFAQAKILSLYTVAETDRQRAAGEGENLEDDNERMKFKEVEARFLRTFSMPKEEKLVNCKSLRDRSSCLFACQGEGI